MHTATNANSHWKRFIDIIRPPFDDRQLTAGSEYVRLVPRAIRRAGGSPAAPGRGLC
jgi:hypothetical protein